MSWIQALTSVTLAYTPGKPGLAHPFPKLTTPMMVDLVSRWSKVMRVNMYVSLPSILCHKERTSRVSLARILPLVSSTDVETENGEMCN